MLHFDDVLIHLLGEFGTYQKRCSFLIFLAIIPLGMSMFSVVFIMAETASWCRLPEPSTEWCGNLSTSACKEMVKNLTIPKEMVYDGCDVVETYSQCYRYDVNYDNISLPVDINNSSKVKCDNGYDYDTSQYKSTVPQEFDLVCDKASLVSVAMSLFLVGILLGSVVIGIVIDRVLPESPRWLISVGKMEEAEKIIRNMGTVNGVELPEKISDQSWNPRKQDVDKGVTGRRFVNTLVYTGISMNTSNLGGNDYISAAISAAVEIPAAVLTFFLVELPRLGSRRSMVIMMTFGGCACLVTPFMPTCGNVVWAGILILMLGKMSILMAYNTIIVYANELYPTPLRSSGVGMCSMVGYIGGILSPQFLELQRVWAPLTLLIFGVLSVIAGILILPLPETPGQKLPETMMEGENFGRKRKPNGNGDEQTKGEDQLETSPSSVNLIVEHEKVLQGLDNAI
ncbi:organic cation transporter protein-like [Ptychodera flava]|uniref:organic cation transporter protein-like n=1 Tax=Ptychodera flava TaxID=63121 RepID=UPI00396A3905